jgi:transmembrane sensor
MNRKDTIESIIVKFLSGSSTEEESVQLIGWLKENRENRRFYFSLKRVWLKTNNSEANKKLIEDSWDRLKLRTTMQSKVAVRDEKGFRIDLRKFSIAASILVLIGISLFLGIQLRSFSNHQLTTISVPMGSRTNISLPDGTNVWLNANSKLTYTSDFSVKNRDISLSGEAYFDVSPHKSSVFTVITRDLNVRALGTEFNVKSYPDEDVTETTLVSGTVEIAVTDEGIMARPVLLKPNQRITYFRAENAIVSLPVETEDIEIKIADTSEAAVKVPVSKPSLEIAQINHPEEYTSWKDGKLVFRGENLASLSRQIERVYNVEISFDDDSLKEMYYTGTLEEVSIVEVLRAIATASNINYKLDKNKVIFYY